MTYDWIAALVYLATLVSLTVAGQKLAFMIPELARMRELNRQADEQKMAKKRFRQAVRVNTQAGKWTNIAFLFLVLPFCIDLTPRPFWRHVVDVIVVLFVFDFFYYLTHRFLFHGKLLRKVHALHHQARTPTHMDAHYVHPLETTIGLCLFLFTIPLVGFATGGPMNAFSMAVATLLFTQLNTINHTYVNLPYFPFKTLDYITGVHAAHHVDMDHGNYATLSMFYDKLFGTYEEPVSRVTP